MVFDADRDDLRIARACVKDEGQRLPRVPNLDVNGKEGIVVVAPRLKVLYGTLFLASDVKSIGSWTVSSLTRKPLRKPNP